MVDGKQYVTIVSGWGGAAGLYWPPAGDAANYEQIGRIFTFAVNGDATMPELVEKTAIDPPELDLEFGEDEVTAGIGLYHAHCARCHGWSATSNTGVTDLRRASAETHEQFEFIVYGARATEGMPSFSNVLSRDEVQLIQAYVITAARQASSATG